jgi:hypothetical protein
MPRFPKNQADIAALAWLLRTGLKDNHAIFPAPPVHWSGIGVRKTQFVNARGIALAARAAAEAAFTAKDVALQELIEAMKADIRYAENTVDFDDDKLKLIGWAGRKAPAVLPAPGQSRLLEAPKQGAGWVFLDWKQPADGGKPAAYTVQRRVGGVVGSEPVGDRWKDIATAILSEITLVDQPEKTQIEYRVIAINKAGEGPESNVVEVVL